jgi:hypothetical protein
MDERSSMKSWLLEERCLVIIAFNNNSNAPLHTPWGGKKRGCAREV